MTNQIGLFATALLLGGIVFFSAVVAPLVFTRLPIEQAGRFIRALFPFYYAYLFVTAAGGALVLALGGADQPAAVVLGAIAAATLWLRQGLMPRINRLSDATQAGDPAARARFNRAHRFSVLANAAQLLAAAWCLGRFG